MKKLQMVYISKLLTCLLILKVFAACESSASPIENNIHIDLYPYESDGEMKASCMAAISEESELSKISRRFDYLLLNKSSINKLENFEVRDKIFSTYPDTIELRRQYLENLINDNTLIEYFNKTYTAAINVYKGQKVKYSLDELMEVASKFFYCKEVLPDSSIQAYVCMGFNGIQEANWKKDYTYLEAFCFEAIFNDIDKEDSRIWKKFGDEKSDLMNELKSESKSLSQYLLSVRSALFEEMKKNSTLKNELIRYYKETDNYCFEIETD